MECLDRMERRAIRDRVALDRQAGVRDLILRGDLSKWLERRIADLEKSAETRDGEVRFCNSAIVAFRLTLNLNLRTRRSCAPCCGARGGGRGRRRCSPSCRTGHSGGPQVRYELIHSIWIFLHKLQVDEHNILGIL